MYRVICMSRSRDGAYNIQFSFMKKNDRNRIILGFFVSLPYFWEKKHTQSPHLFPPSMRNYLFNSRHIEPRALYVKEGINFNKKLVFVVNAIVKGRDNRGRVALHKTQKTGQQCLAINVDTGPMSRRYRHEEGMLTALFS